MAKHDSRKMKKLCYILPEYDPLTAEHYYHIYELLEDVARQLDVCLVIERASGYPKLKGIKNILSLKLKFLPLNLVERFLVFTYIRLKGYNRFYIHYSYSSAIVASLVTGLTGGQTLYWHCGLKKAFMVKWKLNWQVIKKKFLDDYAFLLTLRLINHLVTCSKFMKEYYSTNFGVPKTKIKVMPNWVNLERFDAGKYDREEIRRKFHVGQTTKVALFVHWLAPRTGAHYLVRIAQEVARDIPDVVFLIVGEGPYRETLKHEIEEKGLQGIMRLLGGVPNREIPEYYAIADVFIMPSDEEAFGRVLLEAMAMGVPIVATFHGGMDDILTEKQKQFTVKKGDITNFGAKIIRLLTNESLREELKKEGLERVKYFSMENIAKRFEEIVSGE